MTYSAIPSFICPRSWLGMVTQQESPRWPDGPRPRPAASRPARAESAPQAARSSSTVEIPAVD
jgi:hypothetical protein